MICAGKLSHAAAMKLEPGQFLRCEVVKGLELRGGKTAKSFSFYYRNKLGLRRRPHIGNFPTISIEGARAVAKDLYERVQKGEDPSADKAALRVSPTVADLWERYKDTRGGKALKQSTLDTYESYWNAHVALALGPMKVASVTHSDVEALILKIAKTHKVNANRVRGFISGLFTYAMGPNVALRPAALGNPATGTTHHRERRRRRHITEDEFPRVWTEFRRMSELEPRKCAAILAILMSGTRVTELATAKRSELNLERGCIIRDEHKTDRHDDGDARIMWLPTQTLELIARLPDDHSGLIFGAGIDRYSLRRVWLQITKAAGCPDLRLQDLRRTFASAAASDGLNISQIGELFSHKEEKTTKRYAWLFDRKARGATQQTANTISGLLEGPKGGREVSRGVRTSALKFARVRARA